MKISIVDRALQVALDIHQGKTDRGYKPYILHPLRVAAKMSTEVEIATALLHDVIEEASPPRYVNFNLESFGFPFEIYNAVLLLTIKDLPYNVYIEKISKNKLATKVKIADIEDNINTLRLPKISDSDVERLKKYHTAYNCLKEK